MYRIRFHGRGGQGLKTASRILGSAFFAEGFEVQDAPRYGAERRGAPIFAFVRAGREPIHERGVIARPDLVVVIDESLLQVAAAGVMAGVDEHAVMLLNSAHTPRLEGAQQPGRVVLMPELTEVAARGGAPLMATACAGAAARLTGVISGDALRHGVAEELNVLGEEVLAHNLELALSAYHRVDENTGIVREGAPPPLASLPPPEWISLLRTDVEHAVPTIFQAGTSAASRTGLWRTERPIIDPGLCKRCRWVCSTFCPDGVIQAEPGSLPEIDYDHCKGCLVCLVQCPSHAIQAVLERDAAGTPGEGAPWHAS